jgi:galactonate dehydratase
LIERLKITGVRTVAVGAGWRNYVFVLIDTDKGITGLGEASLGGQTHSVLGAITDLEPLLIGADPFRIEHLWQQAYRHAFWHGGVTFLSALAGVEVALWDIKGKALGVPISKMLGGLTRDKIRAYANGPRGTTPDELARSAADLVSQGFSAMKFTPFEATPLLAGRRFIDQAVAKTKAVREAVGPEVELMIDGHGRLSPAVAVRAAEALAEFNLMFFEEPCLPEHTAAMARIAKKIPHPDRDRRTALHPLGSSRRAGLAQNRRAATGHYSKRGALRSAQDRRPGRNALRFGRASQSLELGQHCFLVASGRGHAELPDSRSHRRIGAL